MACAYAARQQAKLKMGRVMQNASFSLAEVAYKAGDITYQVRESVKSAQLKVRTNQENVSGVMLPVFEHYTDGTDGAGFRMLICSI